MSNRFLDRIDTESGTQKASTNLRDLLVDTMQRRYPNDPRYRNGETYTADAPDVLRELSLRPVNDPKKDLTTRGADNIVNVNSSLNQKTKYKLNKMLPTIDDFDFDDLLDDEFEYYVNGNLFTTPRVDGLFVINREISINPPDFHDAYIQSGPNTMPARLTQESEISDVIEETFCVFYIQNSRALPIPNYKTLEVMLVERSKTYDDITEATPAQISEFDLKLDGRYTSDIDGNPRDAYQEFLFRMVVDRTIAWNPRVRFQSGYRPGLDSDGRVLYRDPGDYRRQGTENEIGTEIYNGLYLDIVYQKQTYREKLRERFEGKMVILQWPGPATAAAGFDTSVTNDTDDILSDDKIFLVRIMINGFWKGVVSQGTLRHYALINNIDLSGIFYSEQPDVFDEELGGSDQAGFIIGGLYTEDGLINAIVQGGGATVFQDENITFQEINEIYNLAREEQRKIDDGYYQAKFDDFERRFEEAQRIIDLYKYDRGSFAAAGYTRSDYDRARAEKQSVSYQTNRLDVVFNEAKELANSISKLIDNTKSPGWSDFAHIVEADRLDATEYIDYINNQSNGLEPFDVEFLNPYEPAGSIKYYPASQLNKLFQQAADQAGIDVVKKQIMELLPELNNRAKELDERFKEQPASYEEYAIKQLGPNADFYGVTMGSKGGQWHLKKRKSSGTIKDKGSAGMLWRLVEKKNMILNWMSMDKQDKLFYDPSSGIDYYRLVGRDCVYVSALQQYVGKLCQQSWIETIDDDGEGIAEKLILQQQQEDAIATTIDTNVDQVAGNLATGIDQSLDNLGNSIENATNTLGANISNFDPDIDTNFPPSNINVSSDGTPLEGTPVGGALDDLNASINNGLTNLGEGVNNLTSNVGSSLNDSLDQLGSGIQDVGDDIGQTFDEAGDRIATNIRRAGDTLVAGSTHAISRLFDVIGKITTIRTTIKSPIEVGTVTAFDNMRRKRIPTNRLQRRNKTYMKKQKYHQLCMAAYLFYYEVRADVSGLLDIDGNPIDIFEGGELIDLKFGDYRAQIDEVLDGVQDIDRRVMSSTTLAEFQEIYDDLLQYNEYFNNIDLDIFEQGEEFKIKIDKIVKRMVKHQYNAVQKIREHVNSKRSNKYFIPWNDNAKSIVEEYMGQGSFTAYNHPDYEP